MVFDLERHRPTQSRLDQRCGQSDALSIPTDDSRESALYPKVVFYGDEDVFEYVSPLDLDSQTHASLGPPSMLFWHIRLYICLLMMFYLGCTEEPGWSKGVLHSLELHATLLASLCEQWKARRVL